jgi:hypothetical protein
MKTKELKQFVKTRAGVGLKRLEDAFFLQRCMGGYAERQKLKATDLEVAAAVVESRKEIIQTLADLIALQAMCEQSKILGGILLRRHKRMIDEMNKEARAIKKSGGASDGEKKAAAISLGTGAGKGEAKVQPHV